MLALLFVVLPLVEIYLLIQVGHVIGAWWTILLLLADGIAGSWLMKREGRRAWRALREAIDQRRMPARELADAALILVGGTLLLTPGFLSDVVGRSASLPVTRPLARRRAGPVGHPASLGGSGGPGAPAPVPGRDNAPDPMMRGPGRGRRLAGPAGRSGGLGLLLGRRGAGARGRSRRRAAARGAR